MAQCLEYDITTQVKSLRNLPKAIEYAIVGHIIVSIETGVDPFESIPRAPEVFQEAFTSGERMPDLDSKRYPLRIPEEVLPMYIPQERDIRVGDFAMT